MAYQLREIFICLCLAMLGTTTLAAQGNFEDAELVNEFITMSFSTSHPYDLRHTIPGEPDIDYPIYSAVPKTSFDCIGRHEGYYADIEARCQVFRICANTDLVGRGFAFLCPNGTLFSQKNFVCDWYRNVDCGESELYYSKNDGNRIGTKAEIMETVRQMMEHPMKTISIALNRGKLITPQPATYSSSTAASNSRNNPNQQFNSRRQPVTLREIESAPGASQRNSQNRPDYAFNGGSRSTQTPLTSSSSLSNRNLSPTQNAFPATYSNPSLSQETPFEANPSVSTTPSYSTESSSDSSGVYVSNLGELSTDPEANFNPQTARILAESTSSSIDVQSKGESGNLNKMNFAEKVNAGLNGQEVNTNDIIAPEYVKNIIQQNVPSPKSAIEPPSFSFASNINSLLDEIAYESELEGQTSMQVQLKTPSSTIDETTKKPFRFLSRGFSYENRKTGAYTYAPPSFAKTSSARYQPSTSTQSYIQSFTTLAPVVTTEAVHIPSIEINSEPSKIYSTTQLDVSPKFSGRVANELIQGESEARFFSGAKASSFDLSTQKDEPIEAETDLSPTTKREQKDIGISVNNILQELSDEDKAGANKRAEKLLLAGVKQTILDNVDVDKNDLEETAPIVPLYVRVSEQQVTPTTTVVTSLPLTTSVFKFRSVPASTTTPSSTSAASTTEGIRRYTVSNVRRRQTPRPTIQARRRNPVRSGLRATSSSSSTSTTTTTVRPSARSISRTVSLAPTTATTTTRPNSSSRRRTVSRFSFGSGTRRGASNFSTSTTTTTAVPDKKVAVRSSDKETSDLTAVASTYNVAPKRDYNSVRQTPFKQTQRRRPTSSRVETTTSRTTRTPTTTTTHPPRSSSPLPIATLAPFSSEELSSLSTTSTTPEPLPDTYLSFQDLTKAIFDDSLLQNFRRNQDAAGSTVRATTVRTQPPVHVRQHQVSFSTVKNPRIQERVTQRTTVPAVTSAPHVPLKQFIVNKFGTNYSNQPPNPSTQQQVIHTTPAPRNNILTNVQKQPNFATQNPTQRYIVRQDYSTQPPALIKSVPVVQHLTSIHQSVQQPLQRTVVQQPLQRTVIQQPLQRTVVQQPLQRTVVQQPLQRNVVQQPPQFVIQRLQQVPLQQQFFEVRQQQPLPQQQPVPQHQAVPQQQYVQYQQKLSPSVQPAVFRPVQSVQLIQPIQQTSFGFTNQQQTVQRIPNQQQPQRAIIQRGQEILQRTIPSVQQLQQERQHLQQVPQQFQSIQQAQQLQQQRPQPVQQQFQPVQAQPQIQIFPSQMTVSQTIPGQPSNAAANQNIPPEVGSINVRLPTNLAGLIPNTNLLETKYSSDLFSQAQKRIDQHSDAADAAAGDNKSVYSGLTSYDVPLNSVGRLANDITNLLRRLRRL